MFQRLRESGASSLKRFQESAANVAILSQIKAAIDTKLTLGSSREEDGDDAVAGSTRSADISPEQTPHDSPTFARSVPASVSSTPHHNQLVRQATEPTLSLSDSAGRAPRRGTLFRQRSVFVEIPGLNVKVRIRNDSLDEDLGRLRPELYSQPSKDVENLGEGFLSFALAFDQAKNTLKVQLLSLDELSMKIFTGFVKLHLLEKKKKAQSKVQKKVLQPVFNESFQFDGITSDQLNELTLQFNVYHFDRFSRHNLIGNVMVKRMGELVLPDGCEREFKYTIHPASKEFAEAGELKLSLCYLPSAGRLTVVILRGKNLKAMDITGKSDPYVKVALFLQGKRMKKKKTTVKKNCLDPVFNEALVFDIPHEAFDDVLLMISVVDYDRMKTNELIGMALIGPNVRGPGRGHWQRMKENQRDQVAEWHTLRDKIYWESDLNFAGVRQESVESGSSEKS